MTINLLFLGVIILCWRFNIAQYLWIHGFVFNFIFRYGLNPTSYSFSRLLTNLIKQRIFKKNSFSERWLVFFFLLRSESKEFFWESFFFFVNLINSFGSRIVNIKKICSLSNWIMFLMNKFNQFFSLLISYWDILLSHFCLFSLFIW